MESFVSLKGKKRLDFCKWQFEYYRKFNGACVILGAIAYIAFFVFDVVYGGTFDTLPYRLLGFLIVASKVVVFRRPFGFRGSVFCSHLAAHLMVLGSAFSIGEYCQPRYAGDSLIMLMLVVFALGIAAPFEEAVLSHLLFIAEVFLTRGVANYPDFLLMMSFIVIPSTAGLIFVQYYITNAHYAIYRSREELLKMSCTDQLTGLYNRRAVENLEKGTDAYVFLVDIDFFKRINDTYGHETGDEVLKCIACLIGDFSKSNVGEKENLAIRWGGEEFLILVYNRCKSMEELGEALRKSVEGLDIGISPITISVGMFDNRDMLPLEKSVELADKALYDAKENGRNRCSSYKKP